MFVIMKIIASAIVIAIVTEISRRFPSYGGIVAALPLVSLLSIIWLYVDWKSVVWGKRGDSGVSRCE